VIVISEARLKQLYATALGLFSSATIAATCMAILEPIGGRYLNTILFSAVIFFIYTAIAALIFGFPGFLALNKFGLVRWWSLTAHGALVGLISLVVFISDKLRNVKSLLAVSTIGAIAGFVFWICWRTGRTGKSDKKNVILFLQCI
jgi:hypothetical protein